MASYVSADSWICGECNHGPQLSALNPACCNCHHRLDLERATPFQSGRVSKLGVDFQLSHAGLSAHSISALPNPNQFFSSHELKVPIFPEPRYDIIKEGRGKDIAVAKGQRSASPLRSEEQDRWARALNFEILLDTENLDASDDTDCISECSTCSVSSDESEGPFIGGKDIASVSKSLSARIIKILVNKFTGPEALVKFYTAVCQAGRSEEGCHNDTITSSSSSQSSHSFNKRGRNGRSSKARRSVNDGQDENDEEDNEGDHGDRKKRARSNISRQLQLACPFFKNDPRHPAVRGSCRRSGWATIHRLKEHLERAHRLFRCRRCGRAFQKDEQLETHERSEEQCLVGQLYPVFGVDQPKYNAIKSKRAMRGRGDTEKWNNIYEILFPHAKTIPFAYFTEADQELGENLMDDQNFESPPRQFWDCLHHRLSTRLEASLQQALINAPTASFKTDLNGVLKECIDEARLEACPDQGLQVPHSDSTPDLPSLHGSLGDSVIESPVFDELELPLSEFGQASPSIPETVTVRPGGLLETSLPREGLQQPDHTEPIQTNGADTFGISPRNAMLEPFVNQASASSWESLESNKYEGHNLPGTTDAAFLSLYNTSTSARASDWSHHLDEALPHEELTADHLDDYFDFGAGSGHFQGD